MADQDYLQGQDAILGGQPPLPQQEAVLGSEEGRDRLYDQLANPSHPGQTLDLLGFPKIEAVQLKTAQLVRENDRLIVNSCSILVFHYVEYLSFANKSIPLSMVWVPSGSFMMGPAEGDCNGRTLFPSAFDYFDSDISHNHDESSQDHDSDDSSQHQVTLPGFWMGQFPVLQSQWQAVATMPTISRRWLEPNPSDFKGRKRPVERVSWDDTVEFCKKMTRHTNRNYRLPSEAEWEYACRAGTTTAFSFGETLTTDFANYDRRFGYRDGLRGTHRCSTTSVNEFEYANAFGLWDMHGNVWEWCADYWHNNYDGAPSDGRAWCEAGRRDMRIIRGGAWDSDRHTCRSNVRNGYDPGFDCCNDIGFRVVVSMPALEYSG